jgi:ribosomal protein S18 acetylase RimI-like enzyme
VDAAAWYLRTLDSMEPFWRTVVAQSPDASLIEDDGVLAAIVPLAPNRSFFNSVLYRDPERLAARLPEIATAYDEAGVNAWTVWTPRSHTATAELLRDAGHNLDAQPRLMALEDLDRIEAPDLDGVEWTRDPAPEEFARVTDEGFGMGEEGFQRAVLGRFAVPGSYQYLARLDGKPATTAMVIDAGEDAGIYAIATVPEARGKGLARNLMLQALRDARERGRETSTLQATKEGFRIYEGMGYEEIEPIDMWERRRVE